MLPNVGGTLVNGAGGVTTALISGSEVGVGVEVLKGAGYAPVSLRSPITVRSAPQEVRAASMPQTVWRSAWRRCSCQRRERLDGPR